jgi:predicted glycoside hydrolase/deacetylase ChbG (UPF0249 family)
MHIERSKPKMNRNLILHGLVGLLGLGVAESVFGAVPGEDAAAGAIRLIVQGDDMGSAHAANEAFMQCYKDGIMRTAEVMVPGPWFEEAARLCKENPGLEVGVHLTLTSEWDNVKWRPLTHAPSLVNPDGYFFQMTGSGWPPGVQWPPGTAFKDAAVKIEDVEKELRAQIELAKRKIANVTHVTAHMGTATCRPELKDLVSRLADEYGLITWDDLTSKGVQYTGGWGSNSDAPEQRAAALAEKLRQLEPGTWIIVEHPGLDTPEMRALGHPGSSNIAQARWGVTRAYTSPEVKQIIKDRGIQLITYTDLK